ncbi:phage major capsid protein [Bacillus velezensis]|uniref:phage major capsid protein n=1 Tax=Bacillus TaxID=1386 RepID=UPI001C527241|nr:MULTISPECIES: phage major capsid protein [Bacillus amyloliquefaciens group]QXP99251.1 phage major capsid protein [Bacillus velezensis]UHH01322.1 phage major capsid protein [Bacillus amyloliquefaciens]ULR21070.1 phage major capsid protein [Bacillus velezensis]UVW07813.1 phage major capsid protein [Bacillus velezensis]WHL75119.1 phage major capsid protein [Bacillus velezensis]
MNLYQLKNSLTTVGAELKRVEEEIANTAGDPNIDISNIENLERQKINLKKRFDILKNQHDSLEQEQEQEIKARANQNGASQVKGMDSPDPKQRKIAAKAELFRATMRGREVSEEVKAQLGGVKAVLGDNGDSGGEKLLPTTMTTELLHEPFVKNPLRGHSTFTNEINLELPKISFQLDDDEFIGDTETAKELKSTGDIVKFGRNKFKVFAPISETVLRGTDTNLVQTVDRALESGLAAKEKKVAFATTPKKGEEHMSFYSAEIKTVEGSTKLKAIKAAIADLHEDYRANAKVAITYAEYMDIVEDLTNGNATLFNAQPEQILGKPAIFCDAAVDPIVGDFSYSHFNYDLPVTYERDKNVRTGIEDFVLTAYIDHQIKLKSAFRIVKVNDTP